MAFSELEAKGIEKATASFLAKRRPPAYLRNQIDIGYKIVGDSVELEERRLLSGSGLRSSRSFAKATFIPAQRCWKVYWMRANLKWCAYDSRVTVSTLEEFLEEVDLDPYGCFFG